MRALEEEEKTLLQISMEEREKRLRLRRILVRGGIVAGLFILFLAVMAGMLSVSVTEQLKNVAVERAHEESLKQLDSPNKENSQALQLAQFAYYGQGDNMRLDVVQDYYKLAAPYIYNAPDAQGKADSNQPVSFSLRPGEDQFTELLPFAPGPWLAWKTEPSNIGRRAGKKMKSPSMSKHTSKNGIRAMSIHRTITS
ncbi:MAG: hypothetical protein IPJ40_14470 [Saprospirales bacterium]|nr:hypothetical protein [Saprospirales bacterium]